jgi:hypothetical protein
VGESLLLLSENKSLKGSMCAELRPDGIAPLGPLENDSTYHNLSIFSSDRGSFYCIPIELVVPLSLVSRVS